MMKNIGTKISKHNKKQLNRNVYLKIILMIMYFIDLKFYLCLKGYILMNIYSKLRIIMMRKRQKQVYFFSSRTENESKHLKIHIERDGKRNKIYLVN